MLRASWSGRLAFVLAAAGSAIGLGNIWKFPYITGVNGGGAFVLIYLACIALVGIPIFIAELYVGQQSQKNTVQAFEVLHKPKTLWRLPGWLGLVSAVLILSFYSVVGGWILDFEFRSLLGEFSTQNDEFIKGRLASLFADPGRQLMWHTIFMALTIGIVLGGVKNGLERWNKILMPALIGILGLLLLQALFLPGFGKAVRFLFSPNVSKLTVDGLLEAVGHSFFTLSLGMGAILTYGSYLSQKENLSRTALIVALMDTAVALSAGVVIFSVVFSYDLEPGAGPGLIFATLPMLFAKMPGGYALSVSFFLLVAFAALTSAVSILEVVVAYFTEKKNMNRGRATWLCGVSIYAVGLLTVFSTNLLAEVKIFGLNFFDLFDKLTSSYFLPIGGLLISLFVGWVLGEGAVEKVYGQKKFLAFCLLWSLRIIAPLAIAAILIQKLLA